MATAITAPIVDAGPTDEASSNSTATSAIEDHPDGAEIRRQVEFYFSDENLPTDKHLLQCCGGRENLPVSISRIRGFQRMRQYKPKTLVTAALRLSAFLEVSADGKTIKRKVPLTGKNILDPDYFDAEDDDDIAYAPGSRKAKAQQPAQYPVPLLPQTKAKYPEGVSKNMLKATGFEKAYIEPVLTPVEAAEEEEMYALTKPFVERIEIAIQRFKQKRRMHEMYAHVFNKLMRFGGVESGPRMYQGLSKHEMNEMGPEELARALAVHNVPWDRSNENKWVVDFVALCKAFLSSWYPAHYGYASYAIKNACQVPRSFLGYLRFHRVCPEFDDQLATALQICDQAEQELPKVNSLGLALPGDFNKSASVLFGGAQAGMYTGNKSWAEDLKKEGLAVVEIGIRDEEARIKFGTGIAVLGSEAQYDMFESGQLKVLGKDTAYLEVTAINLPDNDTKSAYAEQSEAFKHKLGQLGPLGKLSCKTWHTDDCDDYDLPKDKTKYPNGKPRKAGNGKEYEFWIEESILEDCFVGLKMDATILLLSGGLTILDDIKETMCSFYTWIPNELWMERKPKEVRWLKKGLGLDEDEDEVEILGGNKASADKDASDDDFDDE
ncbi:hypothetical protein CC77DRAFT_1020756 [Alternaria alternata]|uniref:HTH La-type RNA-binding domain-containing protein n=2 Tax=Alternaria alternata complex TaxID=187734 RepID=A0A177DLH6_ALTAL|nr:hypothetical protein CC77DRAFT_1020756 [Alternaria alternata]RII16185.1 hypothetical protein CUC08_Gglean002623 [Alternaria sp. MG1]RYN28130.1 hypothetical protein AA0115_g6025 [Alternaria tenuissima]OAG20227.1 hypothetical protein CC77DRAFT_1020756 [Alternaria alternata]OWY54281.1 Argonaute siRNA chaperone complex subunit Arb1-like protein [Alternaria alternata]RYN50683.1 hypothetical protein AA0114_g5770 [Alternaria tenuissima]